MCVTGKREYKNPKSARRALTEISAVSQRKRKRREQSIYLCNLCQAFHLTSEPVDGNSDRFR